MATSLAFSYSANDPAICRIILCEGSLLSVRSSPLAVRSRTPRLAAELRICRRRPWRGSKRLHQGRQPNGLGTLGAGSEATRQAITAIIASKSLFQCEPFHRHAGSRMLQCPRFSMWKLLTICPAGGRAFRLGKETAPARVMHQRRKPGDVSPGRNGPDVGLGAAPEPSPYAPKSERKIYIAGKSGRWAV